MQQLARREEQIMKLFWKFKKAFVKEIVAELTNPSIHYNSAATLIRNLETKGFLKHIEVGKSFQYYPVVEEEILPYLTGDTTVVVDETTTTTTQPPSVQRPFAGEDGGRGARHPDRRVLVRPLAEATGYLHQVIHTLAIAQAAVVSL